jgi:hypothetical protein
LKAGFTVSGIYSDTSNAVDCPVKAEIIACKVLWADWIRRHGLWIKSAIIPLLI